MKESVEKYRPVRQRTVRGETTKDKAGVLPPAVYTKQQVFNIVDLMVGLENDFNTEDPVGSTREEEEECVQAPGGATQLSFLRGGSARRFKPLPFNILMFTEMVPLSHT